MNVTDNTRALILNALRKRGISHTDLAAKMGLSKSWASRLLSGGIKTLSEAHTDRLEEILGIQFFVVTPNSSVTGTASRLSDLSAEMPELERAMQALIDLAETKKMPFTPRYFTTKEMGGLGQEIIRLAFANEDKPGKVAREVLKLLSE